MKYSEDYLVTGCTSRRLNDGSRICLWLLLCEETTSPACTWIQIGCRVSADERASSRLRDNSSNNRLREPRQRHRPRTGKVTLHTSRLAKRRSTVLVSVRTIKISIKFGSFQKLRKPLRQTHHRSFVPTPRLHMYSLPCLSKPRAPALRPRQSDHPHQMFPWWDAHLLGK